MARSFRVSNLYSLLVCAVILSTGHSLAAEHQVQARQVAEAGDVLVTREWKVPSDLISRAKGTADAVGGGRATGATKDGAGIADRESARNWLIANGVVFNGAASAIYFVRSNRLIVRNTQDQVNLADTIISNGGGWGPVPVEIECKFIEIQQDRPGEVSIDGLLRQANADVLKNGGTPLMTGGGNTLATALDQLISPAAVASSLAPANGAILGVFTDPQMQLILRDIKGKKGIEVVSVPMVTTKSGQRAVIEISRGFVGPSEDMPPQIPRASAAAIESPGAADGTAAADSSAVIPTSSPSSLGRNLGIKLEVKAVVGPDGFTIHLDLTSRVVEFNGFTSPGSPFTWTMTNPLTGVSQRNITTPNVRNQLIFSTRKVTSSICVFDGSAVVLGGQMGANLPKGKNARSIVGAVPPIGRLSSLNYDSNIRRNFLIFVSASLINEGSGGPVWTGDEKEEAVETIAPPEIRPSELPLIPR